MYNRNLLYSGVTPQHTCRPRGYCNELVGRLETEEDNLGTLIDKLGELGCDGGMAFSILRRQVDNQRMRNFSLISMSRIKYHATIDIIVGLLRKIRKERDRSEMSALINSLGIVFFEREDSIGRDRFLVELAGFRPLERDIRARFYSAVKSMWYVTGHEMGYLRRVKSALQLHD